VSGRDGVQTIARYLAGGEPRIGRRDRDAFERLTDAPWRGGVATGERDPVSAVRLLPPVRPGKIVCVGLNYRAHIAESQTLVAGGGEVPREPLLFLKPPSAVVAHGEAVRYPVGVTRLDPEAEMGVVIGRTARRVTPEQALASIAGITCFNDVSARNYQRADGQWTRAKGFDTFAPLGPWIVTGNATEGRNVECRVNGERRQQGNTADLLFSVPVLIGFISHIMTLEPDDVIATGTPAGVGPVQVGDVIEIEVEGVGVLRNPVEAWGS
jgi:2-keto-4-pentenoate hydratase/2-oxohepta-3-ene-1,7-dioic acid hydratase in catechol pathway